jgi:hypothetical protein
MGKVALERYDNYQKNNSKENFIQLAISALIEIQNHLKLFSEKIFQNLGINESIMGKEITSKMIVKLIDEEDDEFDNGIIQLLEYTCLKSLCEDLDIIQARLDGMMPMNDPENYAEYIFFGEFPRLSLTQFGTITIPPSSGQITLKSVASNGEWVKSFAISDVAQLLKGIYTTNMYQDVDFLRALIDNANRTVCLGPKKTFFPYLDSNHYTLFVLNLDEKEVQNKAKLYWYNSFSSYQRSITLESVYQVLKKYCPSLPDRVQFFTPSSPQQLNGSDCGVYTILNMIHQLTGEGDGDIFYDTNIAYRPMICQSLESSTIDPQLIRLLTEV